VPISKHTHTLTSATRSPPTRWWGRRHQIPWEPYQIQAAGRQCLIQSTHSHCPHVARPHDGGRSDQIDTAGAVRSVCVSWCWCRSRCCPCCPCRACNALPVHHWGGAVLAAACRKDILSACTKSDRFDIEHPALQKRCTISDIPAGKVRNSGCKHPAPAPHKKCMLWCCKFLTFLHWKCTLFTVQLRDITRLRVNELIHCPPGDVPEVILVDSGLTESQPRGYNTEVLGTPPN